jgi:hypothetical protein
MHRTRYSKATCLLANHKLQQTLKITNDFSNTT